MILDYLLPLYNLSGLVFVPGRGWNKRTPGAQRLSSKSLTRTLLFSIAYVTSLGKKIITFFSFCFLKGQSGPQGPPGEVGDPGSMVTSTDVILIIKLLMLIRFLQTTVEAGF